MDIKEQSCDTTASDSSVQTDKARAAFYASLGEVCPFVLTTLNHPCFLGDGQVWPGKKPAWTIINRPDSVIIASDGMSDTYWDGGTPLGFGVEICAEMPGNLDIEAAMSSCLFKLVRAVCDDIAYEPANLNLFQHYSCISLESSAPCMPEVFHTTDEGHVGVILGYSSPRIPSSFSTPYGEVRMLPIATLYAKETLALREADQDVGALRDQFVATLKKHEHDGLCFIDRPVMIPDVS
ncbi:hypothetical protein [Thiothrix winogradskyi]|uniref:Suppressor of fused-like domain-containing protein n=1 Tax=Thiothrix winogradskyi TaxID=96472 RepID=A0ABY3SZ81_9GAMM|nr:hypothetical protein [Thiothrix winogradskyi]UJS24812.1 hypothetical protein L2Y54_01885 [Thiothrix winogradskyi]